MVKDGVFLEAEADDWYRRNHDALIKRQPDDDPLWRALKVANLPAPARILEIGCANGYRLEWLRQEFGCECYGIELSALAVEKGQALYPALNLIRGAATDASAITGEFDLIIFGFCLYLMDRSVLFDVARQADQKLRDGGHIAIFDFCTRAAIANAYVHQEGLFSYKFEYARMFSWNPQYNLIFEHRVNHDGSAFAGDEDEAVATSILLKSSAADAYIQKS